MLGFGQVAPYTRFLDVILLPPGPQIFDDRPVRRFHPSWMYCSLHNCSDEPLFIYGPRHSSEHTTIPTSLFLLPPRQRTPRRWDCKGLLVPSDRAAIVGTSIVEGPVILKYRDLRRVKINIVAGRYQCTRSNGILAAGQLDYMVPTISAERLLGFPKCLVPSRNVQSENVEYSRFRPDCSVVKCLKWKNNLRSFA